ncbi:hypothetical protein BJY01DRAFT_230391, partial [Aspergillus pseudoustus]
MEDYSYFSSQHSTLPPLYIPPHKASSAMSLPLIGDLNTSEIYQSLDIHPSYPDLSLAASDSMDFKLPTLTSIESELYQPAPLNLTPRRTASSSSATPTESDCDSLTEIQTSTDPSKQGHKSKNVKRRQQNRDAQRRYRERRDERTKSLEQTVLDLEAKRQWLTNGFYQKSQEVTQLFRDNDLLKSEIHELRQRWQLMIMLLQRPKALQSLSTLMAEDVSPLVGGGAGGAGFRAAPTVDLANLDEFLRCLDAVLVQDNSAGSAAASIHGV